MKKLIPYVVLAFAVFFIATRPNEAADAVGGLLSVLGDVASGVADFLTGVVG